ncbi:dUTP diphosphatase [Maridesulfovibrio hydrothermalis]|uniref:dUTP diphosphatase n=1 Tax=Maridesulfovibrio hydrothermalis AM13 = DSM 14728 TaxID=1121451 RepID=L0RC29_9BACT|nr:dUTP diphosphatase [Maridesulfovibrio hydrothermalis]CCO24309.1 Deoxyuridine 5'-triphosphate nucleotidohydrolase [Maridesulfovibrio hydrothermalis AM13 = DSM 14728]
MITSQTDPVEVKVKFLNDTAKNGGMDYATPNSAGVDLRACIESDFVEINPGEKYAFPAGIAIEITAPGIAGFIYSRSGLGTKDGLTVSQGVGVIDPDYRGEIKVSLLNTSGQKRRIERGQRIAQLVFMPYCHACLIPSEELSETQRGAGGFGHTGKK